MLLCVAKRYLFGVPVVLGLFTIAIGETTTKHTQSTIIWLVSLCCPHVHFITEAWKFAEAINSLSYEIRFFFNCSFWIGNVFFWVSCTQNTYECILFQEISYFLFYTLNAHMVVVVAAIYWVLQQLDNGIQV